MAEAIGLAASIVGLAGAAASTSLALYDFVQTVRFAKDELNALAIEASDLSTVLDHLSVVLSQYNDYILSKTTETINTLIKRCERLLEEFDVTVEQGKVDEDRQSSNVRRNINVLRSAVLSNRQLIIKLNGAERELSEQGAEGLASPAQYGERETENTLSNLFEQEVKAATSPREAALALARDQIPNRDIQLFKAYDDLRHSVPASASIKASLPTSVIQARSNIAPIIGYLTYNSEAESNVDTTKKSTEEMRCLLTELTTTAPTLLDDYITGETGGSESSPSTKETLEQARYEPADEKPKTQYKPPNPEEKPKDAAPEPPFLIWETWSPPEIGRKSLIDCLSERGGGYIWRHEDHGTRWYYIGEKMVLEYRVRQPAVAFASEDRRIRTVVSKQWIPKDVLIEARYEHTAFGEGSYSIPGKLTIQAVRALHIAASDRSEKLLRRLTYTEPRRPQRQLVKALWDHDPKYPEHLGFKKGETFEAELGTSFGCWRGYKNGTSGAFPINYVELVTTNAPESQVSKSRCKVRAISNFSSNQESDLSFQAGDIIEVEEDIYGIRWKGFLNGKQGSVPAHRVIVNAQPGSSPSDIQLTGLISEGIRRTIEKVRRPTTSKT